MLGMGQKLNTNDAAVKDAHSMLKREECASSTEQRLNTNGAVLKDVQIKLRKEEFALGTGQKKLKL